MVVPMAQSWADLRAAQRVGAMVASTVVKWADEKVVEKVELKVVEKADEKVELKGASWVVA